jgi:hypothetical protein
LIKKKKKSDLFWDRVFLLLLGFDSSVRNLERFWR